MSVLNPSLYEQAALAALDFQQSVQSAKLAAEQQRLSKMGVNPFLPLGRDVYMDEDGEWSVQFDYFQDNYLLRHKESGKEKRLDKDTFVSIKYGLGIVGAYPKGPVVKITLADRREQRWRDKVVRMREKRLAKQLGRMETAFWVMGWVWGGCLAFVVTTYLLKWVMHLVLG